jgi:pyruvate/2-oxoglutarate dehydrogenase complex dihydrolipoamide dehydrogenase (E3) component
MNPDVIVVGTGQAGVPLATRLAAAGKNVVIIEAADLGGTCVNDGCTPTKTMVASARAAHVARTASRLGVHVSEVRVDFPAVMARKDAIVRRWREGIARRLQRTGERVRLVRGQARLLAGRTVEVNGERLTAETVIVNVGARPAIPPLPGLETVPYLDNRRLLALRELPAHLLIVGGGYLGCEFGQMFRRFGSEVTIIDRAPHLLEHEDPEVSAALEGAFAAEQIQVVLKSSVERVESAGGGQVLVRLAGGQELRGSHLLVAVGRRPNTDDLGCEAAGVQLDQRGFIVAADDDSYATTAPGIHAVGDVLGGPQFTHTAWDDHRLLFDRLTGRGTRGRSSRTIPFTVFTDPQVAGVGPTEAEARARSIPHEVVTMPFAQVARATEIDETAGVMKLLLDPQTEKVVGCRIVGAEAGELIHILVPLLHAGVSLRAVVDAEFAHPTFAEGVQSLVMKHPRFALS